jgi:adenine-specific DNA-methyltransferase
VVEYMVDEALVAYLTHKLQPRTTDKALGQPQQDFLRLGPAPGELDLEETSAESSPIAAPDTSVLEARLRELFSYTEKEHSFHDKAERRMLIAAIDALRALDPACGSGAFPMGLLQKLVHILKKLDPDNQLWKEQQAVPLREQLAAARSNPDINAKLEQVARIETDMARLEARFSDANYPDYSRKLYLIEKCLFGVDIQPMAVQIAKLRFFISLIVSQKFDATKVNWNINPLPNLETKLVAANALITIKRSGQQLGFASSRKEIDDIEQQLRQGRTDHFALRTYLAKREWRSKDKLLRKQLSVLLQADGFGSADAAKLAGWDPYDQNASAGFFDAETMFLMPKGFDVLIANPPYIKEFTWRQAFDGLRDSPYYQGKMDLWYLFACQALDHLREPDGILSFIATNNWVTNAGASILRNELAARARMLKLIDFVDYKVFGADIQTMILVARNDSSEECFRFDLRRLRLKSATEEDMQNLLQGVHADGLEYLTPEFERTKFLNAAYTFAEGAIERVLNQIASRSNFALDSIEEVAQGIVAPQDFVNNATATKLRGKTAVGDGIFILREDEKRTLNLTPAEEKLVRPYFTTEELGRFYGNKKHKYWVIYTDSSFKNIEKMKPFPNLKRHLDKFSTVITSDNAPYGLHRARAEKFFTGEKIFSLRKCAVPTFTFTDFDCYASQTFNMIKSSRINLKFLTALFNSTVATFWLRHRGKMQGRLFQIDKEPLLRVPIVSPSTSVQNQIATIVDCILITGELTTSTSSRRVYFEQLLNGLFYELYFPEELHEGKLHLFDELAKVRVSDTAAMPTQQAAEAVAVLHATLSHTSHPVRGMLFDLQGLPLVQMIEGHN